MPGMYKYSMEIESNVKKLLLDTKELQDRMDTLEGKEYKINLNIDEKKLGNVISNLEKMLDSLGKGTGDFKQFENLSKELSSIVSEVQSLSKAFGKVDDSGAKTLLSSIQNIDKSLSELSQNILNVNKNMSNMGGNTSGTVKQVENISNAYQNAAKEAEKLADAQSKIGQKTNISSDSAPAIEQQNKLQEELKETQQQAENTAKAILKVTGYRGTNCGDPVTSNKSGATFWDSKKNVANMYGTNSSDKTLWSSELSFTNPFTFDAKKQKYGDITYLGDGADYASREIIELTQRENELRKALDNSTKSGLEEVKMAYELQDVCQRIAKISKDTSNPYGTHSTDWFAEYAKNNGYDGVAITNVLDTPDSYAKNGTEVSDVYITFQREQLQNTTLLAKANHELAESEREVALAELGVTQNKTASSNHSLEDKIKSIFTDAKELKQILESLYNGKYFSFDTSENDDALGRVRELQKILEDYGYKIKNFKDDSEAFCVSGIISSLEEENNVLDKNTKKIKENQQMRSQNQMKDAFPDKDISASVESATNSIKEENNVLEQNTQKVKENTQAKEQNANINLNKYDKRLDSYNGKVDKYQATIARFNDGGWTSDTYLKNVQAVKDAVHEYETLLDNIKTNQNGIASDEDIQNLDKYEKKIKETIATVTNMSAAEKGYNFVSGQKELDKIHKLLAENSKMSSEAKAKIKAYYAEIESGNPSMSLDKIHGEILKIYNAEVEAGRAGRTLWDTLKNSGFHQIAAQMAGMIGVYDVINLGKEAISTIVSLDDALVDLKKTTAMNSTQLEQYYYDANDVAKQMGVTTEEIINQSSAWSRLGYNTAEASTEMAKLSSQFASISPGMEVDEAQSGLVSIMKAWSIDPDQVKSEIMDPINQLGNTMAEDNQDIVEGMERSAAALAAVGTSTKDAFALFSGIQEVLQNAEKSGTSLKSVALRLRSFDETTGEYSEDLANITGELIDLTKTAEHAEGVSIFKPGSTTEFKDLTDYFREIAGIWDEMTQKQQNDFLIKAFGRNQAQAGAALIQNFEAVDKALAEMGESAGKFTTRIYSNVYIEYI